MSDFDAGRTALGYFWDASSPKPYPSLDALLDSIPQEQIRVEGLGFAINNATFWGPLADSKVRDAMTALAAQAQGRMPANFNDFFGFIQNSAVQVTFRDAVVQTAEGTAADIGAGLQQVGDTALTTLKNASGLVTLVPYLLFAGLGFYIYVRAKRG